MTNETLFPSIGTLATKTDEETVNDGVPSFDDNEDKVVQQIDSLCMNCHEQGVTRLMLTSIPYFREVVVMSFRCEHCGAANNEIQSAGEIQVQGTIYTANLLTRSDLDRQIVRSPTCLIAIPELELELPPTGRGQLTTVEGLLKNIVTDLSADQPLRRVQDERGYNAIEALLTTLQGIVGDDEDVDANTTVKGDDKSTPLQPTLTLKLDDPAGNSWIEFIGSMSEPRWSMTRYPRTLQQNIALGLVDPDQVTKDAEDENTEPSDGVVSADEVLIFPGNCPSCGHSIETKMKKTNIPYFKEVLIMSTNCDRCGYRDNEVKSGSAISEKGKKITLKVEDREDLSRDILKSETAGLSIPEIELILSHGTLGGRFTTIEGILNQVYDELSSKAIAGDSVQDEDKEFFQNFLEKLEKCKNVEHPFTLILDDPLANSYMQNLYAPDPDPNMTIEMYERTWQQNEELGLNDIKVEGYTADDADKSKRGEMRAAMDKT